MQQLEDAKNNLSRVLLNRICHYAFTVRGKDAGREAWHFVMVDWDKKEEFLEISRTGALDVLNYGKILKSGYGHDIPQEVKDLPEKFVSDFSKNFFLIRLQTEGQRKTYYVMADAGREYEIGVASSEEEIRHCGKIFYSSSDEDPAEALLDIIEDEYFGISRGIISNSDSRPFDAARNGEIRIVQDYLEAGSDVNCVDKIGWTILHHAAYSGSMDIVQLLMNSGADINLQDKICGRKPIHIAARESHNNIIQFFLRNGLSVNEIDKNKWTLTHYAAWKGNVATVRHLIQNNANINVKEITAGKKPVHIAAEYGHTDVVKFLLDVGENIDDGDQSGRTPLYYAAMTGHVETARFLIGNGADINNRNVFNTKPIHVAKNSEMIELLISHGFSINDLDANEQTPLHHAANLGNFEAVQFLADNEANIGAVNIDGKTPFDVGKHHTDIALYLGDRLGKKFEDQENYCDALKVYRDLLEVQQEKLGHDHTATLKTHNKVATVLYKYRQYEEAVTTFLDVLEKRESNLGSFHVDTWRTKHGLGLVYTALTRYDEAMEILREVLIKREVNLGADHDDTLKVARDIAFVHFKKCEYDEAFKIFKSVFEKRQEFFGKEHPDTVQVSQDMTLVLESRES